MHKSALSWVFARQNILIVVVAAAIVGAGAWRGYSAFSGLSVRVAELEATLASTTALLIASIEETHLDLSETLTREKQDLERRLGGFEREVGVISGTVSTLEKLSKTDPEFLQKYSKVFFLNEHYAPERLAEIGTQYTYSDTRSEKIHALVWPYLRDLLEEANDDGIELYVKSAYRSYNEQRSLKSAYTVTYGAGSANQFSADQGYSEHQLGTTLDFITTGLGGALAGFERTEAYQWLLQNAHTYGFILSYPQQNSYYIFEPWHWRFVGIQLATDLFESGRNFYDLDQREIDEYLVLLFD